MLRATLTVRPMAAGYVVCHAPRRCCTSFRKPQIDIRGIAADPEQAVANMVARRTGERGAATVPRIVELHSAVVEMQSQQKALRTERKRLGKSGGRGSEKERAATAEKGKHVKRAPRLMGQ